MNAFRRLYGAGPLHLIAVVASLAVAGWAADRVFEVSSAVSFLSWFAIALLAHDLVFFWAYAVTDRLTARAVGALERAGVDSSPRRPRAINHLRIPAFVSGVLFVVWFPLILGLDDLAYRGVTGLPPEPYLERWLAVTGALFAASGLLYAARLGRDRAARPSTASRGEP